MQKLPVPRVQVERAFGLLKMRWRVLFKTAEYKTAPKRLQQIVLACVLLHNFLLIEGTPLTVAESGYIDSIMAEASRLLRTDNKIAHYNTGSVVVFPLAAGDSGKVGILRRLHLARLLGFLPADGSVPPRPVVV